MKITAKRNILPFLTLGAGALGLGLRTWLYATGVDASGLLRTDHPANHLVFILTAVVLLALWLVCRQIKDIPAYKYLFPRSVPAAAGCMVAAAGVLLVVFSELVQKQDAVTIVSCILGVMSAASLVITGICRQKRMRPRYYLHFAITAYLTIHVVSQYRIWSSETQLQNYFFQLLASVFLMLCSYYRTLLDTNADKRRRYVFFNYGALFFCCMSITGKNWLFYCSMAIWMASEQCSLRPKKKIAPMQLPKNVLRCINALEDAGFNTYVVGGCVRDSLLGIPPQDYDLCTAATPEQIVDAFPHNPLVRNGEKHGTIGVIMDGQVYEITTFRAEGGYTDNRHPDWVRYVSKVEEDLARRDFTVNAIAYSPTQGYVDPFGGRQDLQDGILRAVGDPQSRFQEDALRILRGIRFALRFRLTPEKETLQAILRCAPLMDSLARERVYSELRKILPMASAQDMLQYQPVFTQIIPELAPTVDFEQHSPHHAYDVYTHTAQVVAAVPPDITMRLAALLHDIGKPVTFTQDENGRGHFYGHAQVSAKMADEVLLRLRAPNNVREQVVFLISHHMDPLTPDRLALLRKLGKYGYKTVDQMIALQKADFFNKGVAEADDPFPRIEEMLQQLNTESVCLTTRDLAVNGNEILSLGVEPGPHIGQCMKFLLELVQGGLIPNKKDKLLEAAEKFLKQ